MGLCWYDLWSFGPVVGKEYGVEWHLPQLTYLLFFFFFTMGAADVCRPLLSTAFLMPERAVVRFDKASGRSPLCSGRVPGVSLEYRSVC